MEKGEEMSITTLFSVEWEETHEAGTYTGELPDSQMRKWECFTRPLIQLTGDFGE